MESESYSQFLRRQEQERERCDAVGNKCKAMPEIVAAAVNRWATAQENAVHPITRKQQLAGEIMARVKCPGFDLVCANRAAEYVVYDGLPMWVINRLLDDLDRADAKGQCSAYLEGKGGSRGKWFNGVLKKRLRDHGIPERKKRGQP